MATRDPLQVDQAAVEHLRRSLTGELILPSDPRYDEARALWNGSIDKRPALIARCGTVDDVVAAVAFARETGLEVAVRGGGHSFPGLSMTNGGITIDLRAMNQVTVDPD